MTCKGDVKSALVNERSELFLIFRVIFKKFAQSSNAFYGKTVLGLLFAKLEVTKNVKLLQMCIRHVAFSIMLERALKAASPGKVLVVYNEYG